MLTKRFELPPRLRNAEGRVRRAGFEFEYAGVGIERSADLVIQVFGGKKDRRSRFCMKVVGSRYGDFSIESDSSLLKEQKYDAFFRAFGLEPGQSDFAARLEDWIETVSEDLVPYEIVTPPIPFTELDCVDELRTTLQSSGAQGTNAHIYSAYGLQFNPEMPSFDVDTLLGFMRAFLLLYDCIAVTTDLPVARRVLPYINPFDPKYVAKVVDPVYAPDLETFMRDYLEANPTRNRPLDWLPLFAWLNKDLVFEYPVEKNLIKPRPTLHYRLPSSLIDDPNWSIADDWNKWMKVERLASDPQNMRILMSDWGQIHSGFQMRSESRWVMRANEWLNGDVR